MASFTLTSCNFLTSVASTTTYPLQVIKARLQQRSQVIEISETTGEVIVSKREYSGVLDCIRRIIKNEGMNGFFKGCLTNALRVAPSAAITFVTYEFVTYQARHSAQTSTCFQATPVTWFLCNLVWHS